MSLKKNKLTWTEILPWFTAHFTEHIRQNVPLTVINSKKLLQYRIHSNEIDDKAHNWKKNN